MPEINRHTDITRDTIILQAGTKIPTRDTRHSYENRSQIQFGYKKNLDTGTTRDTDKMTDTATHVQPTLKSVSSQLVLKIFFCH
jgi:hypothetical protein